MKLMDRLLALIRQPARLDGGGRGRGYRAMPGWARPAMVRVRSCAVCGGDPRHLCRRCREVTF